MNTITFPLRNLFTRIFSSKRHNLENERTWPYFIKRPLSAAEQVLFQRLQRALPDYLIMPLTPLTRVLGVKKEKNAWAWNQRIHALQFDFIVCDANANVIAAIEVDETPYAQADDLTKEKVCQGAKLRLIRWHMRLLPDEAGIRAAFSNPVRLPDPQAVQDFDEMQLNLG